MLPALSPMNVIRFAVAVVVAASGIVSLLLFVARIHRRDYGLLYFGLGATLYGMRLFLQVASQAGGTADLAITLLLPVPLELFMVEAVAREWRKVVWWIVSADLLAAAFAMSARLLQPNSALPWRINTIVVLASVPIWVSMAFLPRRPPSRDMHVLRSGLIVFLIFVLYTNLFFLGWLPGSGYFEFIGFGVLLGCLGYVALSRTQRNEERLLSLHKELEIARNIQAQLLPQPALKAGGLTIASRYVPATSVAGDFYDFLVKDGSLGVLIADVSGHGIPAALSASMVKVAVRAQTERAAEPAGVLYGMNSILCGNLQGQFVSAAYLFLNPAQKILTYAGAGHPPLLVWRSRDQQIESLEENGFPLGIFSDGRYSAKAVPLAHGDRCVLYTDGLLEAPGRTGEEFGLERLKTFLAEHAAMPAQALCDKLIQRLAQWCDPAQQAHDDLTIVVVDFA
jgi:phosphoserine phosphatase RsbU/P